MIDWLLRNRRTGGLTLVQVPNAPLLVWLATEVVRWVLRPDGTPGTVLDVVGTAALVIWAGDEVARGVNPARRLLGVGVLVVMLLRWLGY